MSVLITFTLPLNSGSRAAACASLMAFIFGFASPAAPSNPTWPITTGMFGVLRSLRTSRMKLAMFLVYSAV